MTGACHVGLERAALEEIVARIDPVVCRRTYLRGSVLFREGEEPAFLYAVHEGAVKVVRSSGLGRDVITEILFSGDLCGALCCLDDRPLPVTGVCLVDCLVSLLPREDFLRLSRLDPSLMATATQVCREKTRLQREMMVGMAAERADQRMARALLMLADRLGHPTAKGVRFPLPLDRQELADLIGTTVETAIRVMSRFRREHLVAEPRGEVLIADPEALQAIAQGS